METNKKDKYSKLDNILSKVIIAAESAQRECRKRNPNDTKVCQLAFENLEGLLSQIEACVFSDCLHMEQHYLR